MAISAATIDPSRVGGNLESAHAILAGLDPAHEIGFAMAMGKLMTVHLNDQNGIKYDQDKTFGVENLRSAFNQVKVLKENNYGEHGEYVGLDVKAMRTTRDADSFKGFSCSAASKSGEYPHRKNRAFRLTAETLCFRILGSSQALMFMKNYESLPAIL